MTKESMLDFINIKGGFFPLLLLVALSFSCLAGCEKPKDSFKESRRHFQLGLQKFREMNMGEAVLEFRYALHLDPGFDEPHYYLGLAYQKIGSWDEAIRYFKLYLKFKPEHTDTHLQLARIYHRKGQDSEALVEGKYLLDKLPDNDAALVEIHSILGDIYLKMKRDYDAAAYHYRQVIEYDPQRPDAYLAFAKIYLAQEQEENAIEMLKQVLQFDPTNQEAIENLITLYKKRGQQEQLIELYQKMLQQTPAKEVRLIAGIHSELAQIYKEQGKDHLARQEALKTLEKDPADSQARAVLAKGYMQAREYESARKELEILSKQNYKPEETLMNLALAYRKLKLPIKAIDAYEKVIFLRPDNFRAQYFLTLLCLQTQRWDRAIRAAHDILIRFYDFPPAYLFLGRAYLFIEKRKKAIENLELFFLPEGKRPHKQERSFYETAYPYLLPPQEFLEQDRRKRTIEAHYLLGVAFLGEQRLTEALEQFNKVSHLLPTLGDVYLSKAIVYHLLADFDQAIRNCQLASQQVQVNNQLLHFIQANIYTSSGDLTKANQHMKQAGNLIYGFELGKMDITRNVSVEQPLSLAHLSLGTVYLLNGWKEQAKPEFKKVLEANPANPLARYLNNELYQLMSKYYYKSTHLAKVIAQIYHD